MLIGTNITDWNTVDGAYYAGQGTEAVWLGLSVLLCVAALIAGLRHEKKAYSKIG
jgi:hypothetical protein